MLLVVDGWGRGIQGAVRGMTYQHAEATVPRIQPSHDSTLTHLSSAPCGHGKHLHTILHAHFMRAATHVCLAVPFIKVNYSYLLGCGKYCGKKSRAERGNLKWGGKRHRDKQTNRQTVGRGRGRGRQREGPRARLRLGARANKDQRTGLRLLSKFQEPAKDTGKTRERKEAMADLKLAPSLNYLPSLPHQCTRVGVCLAGMIFIPSFTGGCWLLGLGVWGGQVAGMDVEEPLTSIHQA